jgi:N6-adenosine-specific RNA methylase IME4
MARKTSYEIYNKEAEKRTLKNPLPDTYPKLPKKKFDIIYADPPWDYGGKMQFDKSGKQAENINYSKKIFISSASFQYPTVKLETLKEIPIEDISNDDSLLFMWATSPHLEQAIELGQSWGFKYRTVAFIWDKMSHNPGQYTLSNCELCLVFKKGRIPKPRGARNVQQLIRSPRSKHSAKPIEVLHSIDKMFPTQKKVELFARSKNKGWNSWGLDLVINQSGSKDETLF